jgi:hypothetical protein
MREPTDEERALLEHRRHRFEGFLEERMPVLKDFMERLQLPNPAMVLLEADRYLPPLDQWMKTQDVPAEDRVWIITRIGYFVGEWLVQRFGGYWFLNDIPDSRYFGRYVVGRFSRIKLQNPDTMVDPFQVAADYISEPPGRSLSKILGVVEEQLLEMQV